MMITVAVDKAVSIANIGSKAISNISFSSDILSLIILIVRHSIVIPAGRVTSIGDSSTKSKPEENISKMKATVDT